VIGFDWLVTMISLCGVKSNWFFSSHPSIFTHYFPLLFLVWPSLVWCKPNKHLSLYWSANVPHPLHECAGLSPFSQILRIRYPRASPVLAQYVTLQKYFPRPWSKSSYLLFSNPTHKTKTGTANRWETTK